MMKLKIATLMGLPGLLAACESMTPFSAPSELKPRIETGAGETNNADALASFGALKDSTLPKGECGMILWTLDADRPIPIFRFVSGKSAEIVINQQLISLQRVESDGASSFGVFENQKFAAPDGFSVEVDVRFSLGFDGGSYLERGLIAVETAAGWRAVAPSAGLAGCRLR